MNMAAPKGNNYKMKWKTPEERKAACESFCDHVRSGFSQESWPDADFDTVKRYMRDFPEDFVPDMINKAKREAYMFYEKMGIEGTLGQIKGFNAKSWEFNMKNRHNWKDKQETELSGEVKIVVQNYGEKE